MAGTYPYEVSILAHLRDVSPKFQDSIGGALKRSRVPQSDFKGRLARRVSYHTPRDAFEPNDKAAVVGKLYLLIKEKLAIGKSFNGEDVSRARIFLEGTEGTIWMDAWFARRNETDGDAKAQHRTLVRNQMETIRARDAARALSLLPSSNIVTGLPCPVCLGVVCGRGPLCPQVEPGNVIPVEAPASPEAITTPIQEPGQVWGVQAQTLRTWIPSTHMRSFTSMFLFGMLLFGMVTSTAVLFYRKSDMRNV